MTTFDCAVVGSSVAAFGAILEASKARRSIVWMPCLYDNGDLRSTFVLETQTAMGSGYDLEAEAERLVEQRGKVLSSLTSPTRIARAGDVWTFRNDAALVDTARCLVFAPYGAELGLDDLGISHELLNVFVALEASSDAPLLGGRRVAVYGRGYRALEHAVWLSRAAPSRLVVCVEDRLHAWKSSRAWSAFSAERDGSFPIDILEECRGLEIDSLGGERIVSVATIGGPRQLASDHLVIGARLAPDDSAFEGSPIATSGADDACFALAGLAAGVRYEDHDGMLRSGADAMRRVLRSLS